MMTSYDTRSGYESERGKNRKGRPARQIAGAACQQGHNQPSPYQLTAAAYRVVSRKGYYNFTIKDIAREAGLSTGLVHYYFKDKQSFSSRF